MKRPPSAPRIFNSTRLAPLAALLFVFMLASPAAAAPTPAVQLRETLGRMLGEHTFLAMEAMRAVVQQTGDADPLVDALGENSNDLETAFGGIYGAPAGAEFGRLWRTHIDGLVAYAVARQQGDETAADAALSSLAAYRQAFSAFLTRTDPALGGEHEAVALQLHIDQLVAFADAEYERAFQAERVAYRHMFDLGDHFASAIARSFPGRFPGARVAFSPSGELRIDLGRLLGEHVVLAAQAMRAGIDESPDSQAAADALVENTEELSGVVARVYGEEAGDAFSAAWAPHIDRYLDYVAAIVADDTAAQEQALEALRAYASQVANFLADANPKFSRVGVNQLIGHHLEALIAIVDRYAAGDPAGSVAAVRQAHLHMFEVAAALTRGIIAQFPDRFADLDRMPFTDAAAMNAPSTTDPGWAPQAALALFGLVCFTLAHRIRAAARAQSPGASDGLLQ